MKLTQLGNSDLQVSEICLGTMTWGEQNSREDAFEQLDYAMECGINFIDTAELYSVPPRAETYGRTETFIGEWFKANPSFRGKIILASKIGGIGVPWVRDGGGINPDSINSAIDGSLERLGVDHIDLYQLHWPNRPAPQFARHWPGSIEHRVGSANEQRDAFLEILRALEENVKQGKIAYIGLSNDTPWGLSQYLNLASQFDLPKVVSVQNEFNLLHMIDHPHLFEACALENVAYLPWSPLAGGALSGKYRHGALPENCRWTMNQRNGIFRDTALSHQAIEAYYEIAQRHGLSVTELSLAYVFQFPGVTSTIIGATSIPQLKENIGAYQIKLSEEVLAEIDQVIRQYPIPF